PGGSEGEARLGPRWPKLPWGLSACQADDDRISAGPFRVGRLGAAPGRRQPEPGLGLVGLALALEKPAQVVGGVHVAGFSREPPQDLRLLGPTSTLQEKAQVVRGVRVPGLGPPPEPRLRLIDVAAHLQR